MGKMLVKSKLEAYLLQERESLYKKHEEVTREIDNNPDDVGGKLVAQGIYSNAIDILDVIVGKLPEFEVDLKLIPKDMVAQIVPSEKSVIPIEEYVEAIKPFDELGIKAFVLSEPLAEAIKWTNKDEVIREIQGLIDYLRGANNGNSNT